MVSVISKASARIGFLRRLSPQLDSLFLRELYTKCIRLSLEYGSIVWSGLQTTDANLLEKCNRRAARLILKVRTSTSCDLPPDLLLARAGILRLEPRRKLEQVTFCIGYFARNSQPIFRNLFQGGFRLLQLIRCNFGGRPFVFHSQRKRPTELPFLHSFFYLELSS